MPDPVVSETPPVQAVVVPPVVTPPVTPPPADGSSPPPPIPEVHNEFRDWLLTQPEELQNDTLLQNFKSMQDLARGYSETKRWADGRVKLPDVNTPPEEVNKFYQRLGVPEKAEDYEFTKVDINPAVGVDTSMLDAMKPVFLEMKMTKAQADGVQKVYLEKLQETHNRLVTEYTAQMTQQQTVLKGRWGEAYQLNVDLAMRTFAKNATPTLAATVEREGWGNNPDFIELFFNLGVATGEDTFRPAGPVETKTVDAEIKTVETQLYNMPENDPARKDLVKKRAELYEQRYPQTE